MNVLLIEPNYPIKLPNLALLKLSTKHKKLGDNVEYFKGNGYFFKNTPDIIYISTMFTYYSKETIDCINFYKNTFKKAELQVGGIFASLMPEYVEEKTGIKPFVGCSNELDKLKPDYDLIQDMIKFSPFLTKFENFSLLFTTRGCPRRCAFCAVKDIEKEDIIIPNWKDFIDTSKKNVAFFDNNLTAYPIEHLKDIINFIKEHDLRPLFFNGFDVRLMNDEHIELLASIKYYPGGLRVAFDNMSANKYFQKNVKKLLDAGVSKSSFLTFTLFNFRDKFDEAMYRFNESKKLGVRPYPQVFSKLDQLTKEIVPSKHWNIKLIRMVREYWVLGGNYKYKTFDEFLAKKKLKISDLMNKDVK